MTYTVTDQGLTPLLEGETLTQEQLDNAVALYGADSFAVEED